MFLSMNTIPDLEKLYASLGERDYEAVMSHLANDIVWIVADNSPLADTPVAVVPDFQGSWNAVHFRVRQRADRWIAGGLSYGHHGEARAKLGESYEKH
jgi:hypothetical protein